MTNAIINVYKEKGFTSFDVVAKLRGIFHQKKIGHTGTLDPDAEGVLPVCLGRATKVCDLLTDKDKVYETVLLLGQATDTQDISGKVLETSKLHPTDQEIRQVIASFVGEILQVPPMYSALKVNGQKLCNLARQGIEVERKARPVTIHSIEILELAFPRVRMRVSCSKGTYIRTLCDDIGRALGCFGTMESLLRTSVMHFTLDNAYRLAEIEGMVEDGSIASALIPVDSLFMDHVAGYVQEAYRIPFVNGNRLSSDWIRFEEEPTKRVRIYDWNKSFAGIYEYQDESQDYKPVKLFME